LTWIDVAGLWTPLHCLHKQIWSPGYWLPRPWLGCYCAVWAVISPPASARP